MSWGVCAIHTAATHDHTYVHQWLMGGISIDINVQDNCGNTPLRLAERSNATAAVAWIQLHEASVGIRAYYILSLYIAKGKLHA